MNARTCSIQEVNAAPSRVEPGGAKSESFHPAPHLFVTQFDNLAAAAQDSISEGGHLAYVHRRLSLVAADREGLHHHSIEFARTFRALGLVLRTQQGGEPRL
jgi:hypothetical protein